LSYYCKLRKIYILSKNFINTRLPSVSVAHQDIVANLVILAVATVVALAVANTIASAVALAVISVQ